MRIFNQVIWLFFILIIVNTSNSTNQYNQQQLSESQIILNLQKIDQNNSQYMDVENEQIKIQTQQQIYSFFEKDAIIDANEVDQIIKHQKQRDPMFDGFDELLIKNKLWASQIIESEPDYFTKHANIQKPKYLWIGCSDSRVPANTVVGLKAGQVFVHRNVGNVVPPSDINVMAVIQYAVEVLKIQHIIVAGHYGCGGVRAALTNQNYGSLQNWLSHIRAIRVKHIKQLKKLDTEQRVKKLIELNVMQQVYNIGLMPVIQNAWNNKQKLTIHGVVYDINNGLLKDLKVQIGSYTDLPQDHRFFIPQNE